MSDNAVPCYAMLCYAMLCRFPPLFIYTYKSPGMRLSTYATILKLIEYMGIPHSHERFNAACKHTSNLPSRNRKLFDAPKTPKKSALHAANKLSNGLASTVGDGQSRLQVSADIHQPPFVFPFFAWRIETLLPRLIKRFEPRISTSH